jgi:hypothetical protein
LAEAYRVLRVNGHLVVFDGDYATITVATSEYDPLQTCIESFKASFLRDPWFIRRLSPLVQEAGFAVQHFQSYGYAEWAEPDYMLTLIDRGVEAMVTSRHIGTELGEALITESRRRAASGSFVGHIAYVNLIAQKHTNLGSV